MIQYDDTTNETAEYAAFVEKFKPKKTTDDCYTPPNIYEAVKAWAVKEYGLEGREILRPFYPGGDYLAEEYPDGCVVLDNPPFSILSQICQFYDMMGVDYFLFAPSLTLFSTNAGGSNYIIANAGIVYENGARVKTAFVTNLGEYKIRVSNELYQILKEENDKNINTKKPPTYEYPDYVVTGAILQKMAAYVDLDILKGDAQFIRAMDSQREKKKTIFGGGFILSERAAAERAAAERAAAERAAAERAAAERAAATRWQLSDREREIIAGLGDRGAS